MATYIITSDNKRMLVLYSDPCLYNARDKLIEARPLCPTMTNLYFHTTRLNNNYYYFRDWSLKPDSTDVAKKTHRLCSWEEAEEFLREKLCFDGCSTRDDDQAEELEKEYGFDLMQETA